MKTILQLVLYLMPWMYTFHVMTVIGLLLIATSPLAYHFAGSRMALGLSLWGYAALALPYTAAGHQFRLLISSRRLALTPGFQQQATAAMLLVTLLVSFTLPLLVNLWSSTPIAWQWGWLLFCVCSLYTAMLQWASASRYFIQIFSIAPLVLWLPIFRLLDTLELWQSTGLAVGAPAVVCAAWAAVLVALRKPRAFAPPLRQPFDSANMFMAGFTNWYLPWSKPISKSRSPEGTMLLGYPDSWFNRWQVHTNIVLIWPALSALLIAGFQPRPLGGNGFVSAMFLFAFLCATVSTCGNGELAVRARNLWLRRGGNREEHWRFLERTLLGNLGIMLVLLTGMALLIELSPWQLRPALQPLNILPMAIGTCLLGTYFTLAYRAGHWSIATILGLGIVLGPGVAFAFSQNIFPLPLIAVVVVGVSMLFRALAKRYFLQIDWHAIATSTRRLPSGV